jgi:hypothetical protein
MGKSAVIIGASSGLGKSISYELASRGYNLILSSRNKEALVAIAEDITKSAIEVKVVPIDLELIDYSGSLDFVATCFRYLTDISEVYITAATIDDKDRHTTASQVFKKITVTNYQGPALLVSAFSEKLQSTGSRIVVISSIATVRPRGKNIAYSASKMALEYFVKGLQHGYANSLINFQIFRIGYMDTPMSSDQKLLFRKENPVRVARFIIESKTQKFGYYPKFWFIIALLLNLMPWSIYKRIKF